MEKGDINGHEWLEQPEKGGSEKELQRQLAVQKKGTATAMSQHNFDDKSSGELNQFLVNAASVLGVSDMSQLVLAFASLASRVLTKPRSNTFLMDHQQPICVRNLRLTLRVAKLQQNVQSLEKYKADIKSNIVVAAKPSAAAAGKDVVSAPSEAATFESSAGSGSMEDRMPEAATEEEIQIKSSCIITVGGRLIPSTPSLNITEADAFVVVYSLSSACFARIKGVNRAWAPQMS